MDFECKINRNFVIVTALIFISDSGYERFRAENDTRPHGPQCEHPYRRLPVTMFLYRKNEGGKNSYCHGKRGDKPVPWKRVRVGR